MRRLAAGCLIALAVVALLADFLASSRPLVLRYEGRTYALANLVDYPALRGLHGAGLERAMTSADWALWPPVRHDPLEVRSRGELAPLAPPSARHLLGTDDRGRDVLARLIHGTRVTALIAAGSAVLALLGGLALALTALASRRAGRIIMASCDGLSAIPALLVVVAAQGLIGAGGVMLVVVLIALPRAADSARVARAELSQALSRDFCAAARALGASRWRVLVRHALPQALPQLRVAAALTAATAVLAEAALGFLGFGAPAPTASWGELLAQAHANDLRWWLVLPAGAAITAATASLGALAQPRPGRPSER